jgi:beta-glucosidase
MFMIVGEVASVDGTVSEYKILLAPRYITEAVEEGLIAEKRIDDAVARILKIKMKAGLFEDYDGEGNITPQADRLRDALAEEFGSAEHRELARTAVQKSLVLLKNRCRTLPISKNKYDTLYVVGKNADNFGADCGGWTYSWQGFDGNENKSDRDRTILDGITALAAENGIEVVYAADAADIVVDNTKRALAVAVIGESPYAEFIGDAADLSLDETDRATLNALYDTGLPIAVVMVSGRPMIVTDDIDHWNAFVAAWLPGSQADGVADVMFGDVNFTGKLPMTWPKHMEQIPINIGDGQKGLFDYGYGLEYAHHGRRHHYHHRRHLGR